MYRSSREQIPCHKTFYYKNLNILNAIQMLLLKDYKMLNELKKEFFPKGVGYSAHFFSIWLRLCFTDNGFYCICQHMCQNILLCLNIEN